MNEYTIVFLRRYFLNDPFHILHVYTFQVTLKQNMKYEHIKHSSWYHMYTLLDNEKWGINCHLENKVYFSFDVGGYWITRGIVSSVNTKIDYWLKLEVNSKMSLDSMNHKWHSKFNIYSLIWLIYIITHLVNVQPYIHI